MTARSSVGMVGRVDEALSVGLCRRPGRGHHHTLGRIFDFEKFTEGTHTRRDIRARSTFRAALSLDRFVGAACGTRPEDSNSCARAVPHQVPFKTSNAGHLGPGCVCACPYQGASRGCWPTNGAIDLIPATNRAGNCGPIPQIDTAGRAFASHTASRAALQPRRLRVGPVCRCLRRVGGPTARATVTMTRARNFVVSRPQPGSYPADDGANPLEGFGLFTHAKNMEQVDGQKVGKGVQHERH